MNTGRKTLAFFCLAALLMAAGCASVTGESGEKSELDGWAMKDLLGTGINMGANMEAPDEGEWSGGVITEEDIARISQRGFDSVRLPVRWDTHTGETPPYTVDPGWMDRVQEVVDWCLQYDLAVIVNQHHFNPLFENPEERMPQFVAIWRQIGERFQDYPPSLVFELLNEPHGNVTAEQLNEMQLDAFARIRQTNPTRVVIFGGTGYNSWSALINEVQFPDDPYVMGHWHRYAPNSFTHQQVGGESVMCCDEEQVAEATKGFDEVAEWSARTGIAVALTEFGTQNAAPLEGRVNWMRTVVEQIREKDFACHVWSYHGKNFGLWDRTNEGEWTEALVSLLEVKPKN